MPVLLVLTPLLDCVMLGSLVEPPAVCSQCLLFLAAVAVSVLGVCWRMGDMVQLQQHGWWKGVMCNFR